ncbi:MAG TPA: arsenic resistance N-acetyltransferase ArsN2 [Acidobacteriota bacterium]|nr:arsenic resistance N-acetyltransferase ArsN2 [Acidobacteriota bacterium]
MLQIHFAQKEDVPEIQRLLKSADLPYSDIAEHIRHFIFVKHKSDIVGCVGLEIYEDIALLRSLAVEEKHRNRGLAKMLVQGILQYAREQKITKVFLLTTSADRYFEKLSFKHVDRSTAPDAIQRTTQFTTLCPASAVLMYKELQEVQNQTVA